MLREVAVNLSVPMDLSERLITSPGMSPQSFTPNAWAETLGSPKSWPVRLLYKWSGGALQPAGSTSDAYLRAWEYDVVPQSCWQPEGGDDDTVRLWRTRRPDLAPAELWVGEREIEIE